ncbi:MAG: hypothetical protein VYB28_00385 [Gemmatimonadota bacterium]|nr:hypothetical protein [Gemmatimonadota bacterium]
MSDLLAIQLLSWGEVLSEGVRRVLSVMLGYAVLGWIVLLVGDWVATVLALPVLFETLLRWGLGLGLPCALLIAWNLPRVGQHGGEGFERVTDQES